MQVHYLNRLFAPKALAVVGASDKPGSIGQTVFVNMISGNMIDKVYPVNIKHKMVGGLQAYNSITQINDQLDMIIVLTQPITYEQILDDAIKAKVPYIVIIKNNDDDMDDMEGLMYLKQMVRRAKKYGIRILGPSTLGMIRSISGLNASTYSGEVKKGNVALVSQSSGLCASILDWAGARNIGFSTVVAFGNSIGDLEYGEVLDYLVNDKDTKGIILHVHMVQEGRQLMSALRTAARLKPVIVIKSGNYNELVEDNEVHVGEVVSDEEVFKCAFQRAGVLEVSSFSKMFTAVRVLSSDYRLTGDKLAIVSNGNGLGILAADSAYSLKVKLAQFSKNTIDTLNTILPSQSVGNPIDVLSNAGSLRYRSVTKLCIEDPEVAAVLVIFSPQRDISDNQKIAEMMVQLQKSTTKPIFLSWLGGEKVETSKRYLEKHNCLQFSVPETAIEIFGYMCQFKRNQALLMQIPEREYPKIPARNFEQAHELMEDAKNQGFYVLPEHLSKQLLTLFNIICNYTEMATTRDEALEIANRIGYPVVLKIDSSNVFHKANVGGVKLNIKTDEELVEAYEDVMEHVMVMAPHAQINGVSIQSMHKLVHAREVKISVFTNEIFGPMISFGPSGGVSSALERPGIAMPPLNDIAITELIHSTNLSKALGKFKGMNPVDELAIRTVLMSVSEMVCELPEIREMKIDLLCSPQGAIVSDARVVMNAYIENKEPYAHMAIMPYPRNLEKRMTLKDGTDVTICPVRGEDAPSIQNFVANSLSDESRYNRFMSNIKQLSESVLVRFSQLDYDREIALMMVRTEDFQKHDELGHVHEVLGISRYVIDPDKVSCEFAVSVADKWQGRGIATILMNELFDVAISQGMTEMRGEVLTDNTNMQNLVRKLGFEVHVDPEEESVCLVTKQLVEPKPEDKNDKENIGKKS